MFHDFLATIADLFELELPEEAGPDSFTFLPALTGYESSNKESRKNFVMRSGSDKSIMTIRRGPWKLISGLGSGGFSKSSPNQAESDKVTGQLYNVDADRAETKNLFGAHPELVEELQRELRMIVGQSESNGE